MSEVAERNLEFSRWTRSTAFALNLSGWAITELLILIAYEENSAKVDCVDHGLAMRESAACYLRRRGLIVRCHDEGYTGCWVLTDAGRLVCKLLRAAGFKTAMDD